MRGLVPRCPPNLAHAGRAFTLADALLPVRAARALPFATAPAVLLRGFGNTAATTAAATAVRTPVMHASKTDKEWRAVLTPEQFRVIREKGTEAPGTGQYNKHKEKGTYECAACRTPLYVSDTKFDSSCGWPAFYDAIPGAVSRHPDPDGRRTEITCTACGGHLGHV
ncbi:MAG: methionine sulfoxide reductase domain-containing protein [Olpidium bornovanus]|uniref:Methionine sulfoxide reductase domain-containing protein n=1 Tax=Olpidium bornovanus TaxID=278681 RepID=A0A8H7ZLZ6_9FUNG|nr:MAG: methionine sulfoxide reductase domain-containing protein [Olpidium bornovanus]